MVRILSSAYHSIQFRRIPKLIPAYWFPTSYICIRSRQIISYFHNDVYQFDKMPQKASFEFGFLNLLKTEPAEPFLVSSIHCLSIKTNILLDIVFRTSLLNAYARARDMNSSLALFDEDFARDVISWNAIINACVMNDDFQTYIDLANEMVKDFQEFDTTTLIIVLSAAARTRNLKQGAVLHCNILKRRFDSDIQLCNALINMYAKCGDLTSSEFMFEVMGAKDATSWNSMITGSLYNGFPGKSVLFFWEMTCSVTPPDRISLSSMISACSCSEKFHSLGEAVHVWVIKLGYLGMHDSSIENSLISFYFCYGDVEVAKDIFHRIVHKNIVSWNSMIYGLVENKRIDEALQLFRELLLKTDPQPNAVTLIAAIPACHRLDLLCQGKSIHAFAIRSQLEVSNPSLGNCLLDMYLSYEDFISADLLFCTMPIKDLVSWNTMISGYSKNDILRQYARALFCELLQQDLQCSSATLLGVLPSCTDPQDLYFGKSLHCLGFRYAFVRDVSVVNALMLMYINCGDMFASSLLLRSILPMSDIISLNTIIIGYAQHGHHEDAIKMFLLLHHSLNAQPDQITYVSALSACGNLRLIQLGRSIHALMEKSSAGLDLMARNALITMYFRCSDPTSSEMVFRTIEDHNLCSWNCMISGFAQNKNGREVLEYFKQMGSHRANEFSLVGVLCACSQQGNLRYGREVHGYAIKAGLQANSFISSALLDMYSKCGRLDVSIQVFNNSSEKSIAFWNSMISAFGLHGHGEKAISIFTTMTQLGIQPTKSTFIALLSACSHSGLVDEGCRHYNLMKEVFGFEPCIEHNVCMVDMLGKAGKISEACNFVQKFSSRAEPGTWGAILSSCTDHANLEIGKSVAENLLCLEPDNIGYYITLSNLYACKGMWSKAEEVRSLVYDRGLMKPTGRSVICH
ncbi:pentatricopeptide repeat-containing protein At4g19220, mitochondrial isoform X1 [Dendrobium catenatum]|uniref:Pentatricopeptide repeat-containing protein n=1 Tax=Dendrobium catenatum TaxID=906689 RepID=A0A2I0WP70_9ASPA|nr:pentatricopeptide repeat-containing protein At4g19220, mitochondrial isoform X1 [Dendrobium catenatum]PKU77455.1 Pentatricopeptide repeat-containing protein [Dendrobium catenatum]